jgi:putative membrane protein
MSFDPALLASLLVGTVRLRPYVFAFLIVFLVSASRDLGTGRALMFLVWGWGVAFVAEYASTRMGFPFGMYHYTESTRGVELYLSNVPFFDSLSFPFLAYAAFCLARRTLGTAHGAAVVWLAGGLMTLLDVVIDPLAVRGDQWVLGRVFYYPSGGVYFGVPLSNFAGWLLVGWVIVGGYVLAIRATSGGTRTAEQGSPGAGVALYFLVLAFNLGMTLWIREWKLLAAGILVQACGFLLLYLISMRVARERSRVTVSLRPAPGG